MPAKNDKTNKKSLVFIGFMGVGKTTVAKVIAKKRRLTFIDIDQAIEKEFGMPTTNIFEKFGEKKFREKENEYVLRYSKLPNKIISLGGGAFLQESIRQACLKDTTVIFLDISWEEWKRRLPILTHSRPVLQNKSMAEIKELFYARKKTYSKHHLKVVTDKMNQETIANHILDRLHLK